MGAPTIACALLLDVVVTAKGRALRIVPGPILGPGILPFALLISLLTRGVLPFPVLLQERLEDRLVSRPRLLAFPGALAREPRGRLAFIPFG